MRHQLSLLASSSFDFKQLAYKEILKYHKPNMIKEAVSLCDGFDNKSFDTWGVPGIRAQLVNKKSKKLEMDFVLEGDEKSMHVLNAVSPAFTCSIPFAKFVVDRISLLIK
jgi:L-2-hydroxyglutarate oxidase LhgO